MCLCKNSSDKDALSVAIGIVLGIIVLMGLLLISWAGLHMSVA